MSVRFEPMRSMPVIAAIAAMFLVCASIAAGAPITGPGSPPAATTVPASGPAQPVLEVEKRTFPITGHGNLELMVPTQWQDKFIKPAYGSLQSPSLTLTSPRNPRFRMKLSISPAGKQPSDPGYLRDLRKTAEANGNNILKASVEKYFQVQEFKGASSIGYLYQFTNASDTGNFKYVLGGTMGAGKLTMTISVFYNEGDEVLKDAAMSVLRSATHIPQAAAVAAPTSAPTELRLASPDETWEVVVKNPGLTDIERSPARGNIRDVEATDGSSGLTLTVVIQPAVAGGDAVAARDYFIARAKKGLDKQNVELTGKGDSAGDEYMVPALNQKIADVYRAKDGLWVNVRLSKINFEDKDQQTFDEVLKSVRVEPKAKP